MILVKAQLIADNNPENFQQKLNVFLAKFAPEDIVSTKYSRKVDNQGNSRPFSALVIYKKRV